MNVVNPTPTLTQVYSQAEHFKVLTSQMDLTIKSLSLAGRLSHYTYNWEYIMQDRWVLQAIIGYTASNKKIYTGAYSNFTSDETDPDNKVLYRGAYQNNTRGCRPPDQGYNSRNPGVHSKVSQIFLVEKKGETEASNKSQGPKLLYKGKMKGLHLLPDLVQSQDWMVKLDFKDAYL